MGLFKLSKKRPEKKVAKAIEKPIDLKCAAKRINNKKIRFKLFSK